jgi:hypothetical protein
MKYYITYRDDATPIVEPKSPRAIAHSVDRGDGTYQLDFVASSLFECNDNFTNRENLTIHLEYTCGLGSLFTNAHQRRVEDIRWSIVMTSYYNVAVWGWRVVQTLKL